MPSASRTPRARGAPVRGGRARAAALLAAGVLALAPALLATPPAVAASVQASNGVPEPSAAANEALDEARAVLARDDVPEAVLAVAVKTLLDARDHGTLRGVLVGERTAAAVRVLDVLRAQSPAAFEPLLGELVAAASSPSSPLREPAAAALARLAGARTTTVDALVADLPVVASVERATAILAALGSSGNLKAVPAIIAQLEGERAGAARAALTGLTGHDLGPQAGRAEWQAFWDRHGQMRRDELLEASYEAERRRHAQELAALQSDLAARTQEVVRARIEVLGSDVGRLVAALSDGYPAVRREAATRLAVATAPEAVSAIPVIIARLGYASGVANAGVNGAANAGVNGAANAGASGAANAGASGAANGPAPGEDGGGAKGANGATDDGSARGTEGDGGPDASGTLPGSTADGTAGGETMGGVTVGGVTTSGGTSDATSGGTAVPTASGATKAALGEALPGVESDPQARAALVTALGALGRSRPEVHLVLAEELRSPHPAVADAAADTLATLRGQPGLVEPLLAYLERLAAAGKPADVDLADLLLAIAGNRPARIIERLKPWTRAGPPESGGQPARVRAAALRAILASDETGEALDFAEPVRLDPAGEVRFALAVGLGERLSRSTPPQPAEGARIVVLLGGLLHDLENSVRAEAATALGKSGVASSLEPLEERARVESEISVLTRIVEAIGALGRPAGAAALGRIAAQHAGSRELREAAQSALDALGVPRSAEEWELMAEDLAAAKAHALAARAFGRAVELAADVADLRPLAHRARGRLAQELLEAGQHEAARELLLQLHASEAPDPPAADRLMLLARACEALGRHGEAADHHLARFELLPEGEAGRVAARRAAAMALRRAGRDSEALAHLRALHQAEPGDNALLRELAFAQEAVGQLDQAVESLERLIERVPADDVEQRASVTAQLERLRTARNGGRSAEPAPPQAPAGAEPATPGPNGAPVGLSPPGEPQEAP